MTFKESLEIVLLSLGISFCYVMYSLPEEIKESKQKQECTCNKK